MSERSKAIREMREVIAYGGGYINAHGSYRQVSVAELQSWIDSLSQPAEAETAGIAALKEQNEHLRREKQRLASQLDELCSDIETAAGECLIETPSPGTDKEILLSVIVALRRERDQLRTESERLRGQLAEAGKAWHNWNRDQYPIDWDCTPLDKLPKPE